MIPSTLADSFLNWFKVLVRDFTVLLLEKCCVVLHMHAHVCVCVRMHAYLDFIRIQFPWITQV